MGQEKYKARLLLEEIRYTSSLKINPHKIHSNTTIHPTQNTLHSIFLNNPKTFEMSNLLNTIWPSKFLEDLPLQKCHVIKGITWHFFSNVFMMRMIAFSLTMKVLTIECLCKYLEVLLQQSCRESLSHFTTKVTLLTIDVVEESADVASRHGNLLDGSSILSS